MWQTLEKKKPVWYRPLFWAQQYALSAVLSKRNFAESVLGVYFLLISA
jgi:hypothetical protein